MNKNLFKVSAFLMALLIPFLLIVSCPGDDDPKDPIVNGDEEFTITKGATANGSFTVDPSSLKAKKGATITLKPTANAGYEFDSWTITPSQTVTAQGNNTYTFTMPEGNVTVNAVFKPEDTGTPKFTITKGTSVNGNFTIDPADLRAEEGDIVTLTPTANEGYQFDSWDIVPLQTVTKSGDTYTFIMPEENVTVNAVFREAGAGDGVKTITFESGLGRTSEKSTGTDVYDGTRHITITVTMAAGNITNIATGHPEITLNHPVTGWADNYNSNNPYRTQTTDLITAISSSGNPDAPFTVSGLSGAALTGWAKHETSIRDAIKEAISALEDGKPNRKLEGGGAGLPWTVDGEPLNGEATVTGSGHMRAGGQGSGANFATDMTVKVVVENGLITTIQVSNSTDLSCTQSNVSAWGGNIGSRLGTAWPNTMKTNNHYIPQVTGYLFGSNDSHWNTQSVGGGWGTGAVGDAIGGATRTYRGLAGLVQMALYQIANEY